MKLRKSKFLKSEDWWSVYLGFALIFLTLIGIIDRPILPGRWGGAGGDSIFAVLPTGIIFTGIFTLLIFGISTYFTGDIPKKFLSGFTGVFVLTILAEALGNYQPLRHYGFNNVIWALFIGLLISNTIGVPDFLKGGIKTELYIKTGLVLLGSSVLFNRMLSLGSLGLGVAWVVTPFVLIFMFWYSQKVLKMEENKGLAITIASATSVCGVSAAIATGSASKSKKEEISLAISITLIFTVIMMVAMPIIARLIGLDNLVAGAWLGGTIDATGAVVAAGAILGEEAMEVASLIKMIQNILIGLVAFAVAIFWVVFYENKSVKEAKVSPKEIWYRTPKFILGFIIASITFSFFIPSNLVDNSLGILNGYRSFFFTLAFISIGLDSNLRDMAKMLKNGKPLRLYLIGQSLNIILTLIAAYVFFSGRFFNLPF
ncbi:YeiH family protein [Natronospora cellulosivora (SeqCode)]